METVRSFSVGSAGDSGGFRPGHPLDLVGRSEPMLPLVEALIDFVNLFLPGESPQVRPILFEGNMIALSKNTEASWPIAAGYVWRKLAPKAPTDMQWLGFCLTSLHSSREKYLGLSG